MASSLIAMRVFNERDATVVPELAQELFQDCNVKFDFDNSLVFNTQTTGHYAAQQLQEQESYPCAIAGPFNDMPAQELSVLAAASKFPVTVHRAFNLRVVADDFSPYTSQVFPDLMAHGDQLVAFLRFIGRTDYIAAIYALSDTGIQRSEVLSLSLAGAGMKHRLISYLVPGWEGTADETIRMAMKQVKDSGYRTIVMAPELILRELPLIAAAAEEFGLNNGDYVWVLFGQIDPAMLELGNNNVTKLLSGAAWAGPLELHYVDESSLFLRAWIQSNANDVDRANAANPIEPGEPGHFFAEPDFFQVYRPDYGDGFVFDAVMSTGIGACLANVNGGNVTSEAHVQSIRKVEFSGATGRVKFGVGKENIGARDAETVTWGIFNLLPPIEPFEDFTFADLYINGTWTKFVDFVYADGTTEPPALLRDTPEQNYLNSGIRGFGLASMGIVMALATATILWVYVNREHRILRAAQPQFLYILAFGSIVSVSTVLVISFDESYGWSERALGRACMALPWLLSLGHIITYGALFAKLWRINKVLQFTRRKISVKQVVWPVAALAISALAVLSVWTAIDPFQWERVVIDDVTGESIGECRSDHMTAFLAPLVTLMIIPTILTGFMAWKTKDIDDSYSESQWIFTMIVIQVEVIFIAVPTITVLRDVSTDGRYLGFMFMLLTFPCSALGFVMIPKVLAHRRATHGGATAGSKRGQSSGGVHVSGLMPAVPNGRSSSALDASFNASQSQRSPPTSSMVAESHSHYESAPLTADIATKPEVQSNVDTRIPGDGNENVSAGVLTMVPASEGSGTSPTVPTEPSSSKATLDGEGSTCANDLVN